MAGDKWSLGFVAETERQVVEHLQEHLQKLPSQDMKSQVILQQMIEDEARHGTVAMNIGGVELPAVVKAAMRLLFQSIDPDCLLGLIQAVQKSPAMM
jgi:ubiquinone biosynthesis monooxygenase Coq7